MSQIERTKYLENISDKIERGKFVNKPLTAEQVEELRDQLEEESKNLLDIQDKYTDVKKEYNEKINAHKDSIKEAVNGLRNSYVRIESDVFHIRDYDSGMLYELAPDGSKVNERRLTQEEMQSTINGAQRTASNE